MDKRVSAFAYKLRCKHERLGAYVNLKTKRGQFNCTWCGAKMRRISKKESIALYDLWRNGAKYLLKNVRDAIDNIGVPEES